MVTLIRSGLLLLLLLSGCGWDGTSTRENDFVPLTSIEISAVTSTIAAQTSTRLTATGDFSGLFTRDITDQVVWSSDAPTVADFVTPTDRSRVTGLIPDVAVLRATVGSVFSTFALTVSDATVSSMVITDVPASLPKGRTSQLKVTGTFTDATSQDLTFDADWTSTPGTFATVSNDPASKGLVTALAEGSETITATFGGISATATLTVTVPVLQSITISPASPSLLTLSTRNFTATGTYSDGSTPDITSQVAWSSSDTGIATISSGGAATTLTQGTTTISATLNGINGTTNLKVTGGNLTGITVTPATVTLVKDISSPISAKGTFSNGSTRDITGAVQWTVANTSLASVTPSPSGGNLALLNPLALTSVPVTITATSGILTGTAALTVIAPQLTSIAFSATTLELTAGTSSPLAVIATFSNGSTQDVTALSAVTPNNPAIATVVAGGLATKRVTGIAAGTTTISATYGDLTVTVPATVTVRSRTLQSLTISPITSTVNVGDQVQFTATAIYGDGTTVDVTKETATETATIWTINNQNVAIQVDGVNQPGLIVGVDIGSATLTASFGGKTPTQTTTITVTGP